jgi:hypothetical protein
MNKIVICMICNTPLENENEPCPNCMPSIAWRAPTIKPCYECKRLKQKLSAIRKLLDDYDPPGCNMCEELKEEILELI